MVRQVLCHAYGQPNLLTTHTKASDYPGAFLFCQHRMRVSGVVGVIGVIGVLGVVGVVGGSRSGRRREGNAKSFCNRRQILGLSRGFFILPASDAGGMSSQWQEGKEGKGER